MILIAIILSLVLGLTGCTTDAARQIQATEAPGSGESGHAAALGEPADRGLALYRSTDSRALVRDFYVSLAGSQEVADAVLHWADVYDIPFPLAFALAYEESKFSPGAVNRNRVSVDRGLFQLNSKSFPALSTRDVFDPWTNAQLGLGHLQFCIEQAGNEVTALAMYNAGTAKVSRNGTPRSTLDYIARIQETRNRISRSFNFKTSSSNTKNNTKYQKISSFAVTRLTNPERLDILSKTSIN